MAEWPYNSSTWKRLRALKLLDQPVCEPCERRGVPAPARHVDHKVSIASGGDPFPPLAELMAMCPSCHSIKTAAKDRRGGRGVAFKGCDAEGMPLDPAHPFLAAGGDSGLSTRAKERSLPQGMRPSRVPLILVCGPPGSGKSTYVAKHSEPEDLVIDLDVIRAALSGGEIHHVGREWTGRALEERNRLLRSLSSDRRHRRAWFIFGGARRSERDHWRNMLNAAELVIMDTPQAECVRRIKADPTRRGREAEMEQWVARWFAQQADADRPAGEPA